jgi:hypothetical protein
MYGEDVLKGDWRRRRVVPEVDAERDLVVEDVDSGFCGAVVGFELGAVVLEDRHGKRRNFPLAPAAFLLEGKPVTLRRPAPAAAPPQRRITASGSVAVAGVSAQVAKASRIWVEGIHDAALVERIWGDDLRIEGIVVEPLDGIDELAAAVAAFGPGPRRRLGVLVDHLVPGSKESRIAASVAGPDVLVVGHPFVDVWAAVKPARLGLRAWPDVPRDIEWKHGICAALGWPHATQADIARAWQRILATVSGWTDLEPALLGPVEHLIDFVATPSELING